MNRNIEVINEHLWAVNMQYVKAGYIGGMKLLPDKESDQINLGSSGVIILDKNSKLYPALKEIFPVVMQKSTDELQSLLDSVKNPELLDAFDDLCVNVVGWEIKRRCVMADYLESLPQPTFNDKIKNFLRKKVKKNEYDKYRNRIKR